jgi:hypothetical protein
MLQINSVLTDPVNEQAVSFKFLQNGNLVETQENLIKIKTLKYIFIATSRTDSGDQKS